MRDNGSAGVPEKQPHFSTPRGGRPSDIDRMRHKNNNAAAVTGGAWAAG
jgi:hypothetical protein